MEHRGWWTTERVDYITGQAAATAPEGQPPRARWSTGPSWCAVSVFGDDPPLGRLAVAG